MSLLGYRHTPAYAATVIEQQGVLRARTPKIGCSADQVYSHGRQCVPINWRPVEACDARASTYLP
jgi:hypothetical protein